MDPNEREPYTYDKYEPKKWREMDTRKAEKERDEQAPDAKYYDAPFDSELDDSEYLLDNEPGYEDTEDDDDEENIAGLNELRRLTEKIARDYIGGKALVYTKTRDDKPSENFKLSDEDKEKLKKYLNKEDEDDKNSDGLNELRRLAESYARESLREMDSMPRFWNDNYGPETDDDDDESFEEDGYYNDEIEEPVVDDPKPGDEAELDADPDWEQERDWPMKGATAKDDPIEDEDDEDLYELRQLAESYARESVSRLMTEKKGGWKKKSKKGAKKDKGKKKISSSEKTIMDRLNNDAVNAAHYYYKLYGVENGTEDEKAAARSLGYKKAKGKKLPGKNGNYRFSSKERNKLYTMMTTDNN